ncbi:MULTISPECIES: hypothetical protein [Halobacterium]|uniref:hypothetical protein n=1 Tax=Halobacterium TaxID=2239 RepID=UPI000B33A693|nr:MULTISPECIES: hypothetical protein [Halobacterium]MCG1001889.1 hypothetical protein [Halobacterium noricense]
MNRRGGNQGIPSWIWLIIIAALAILAVIIITALSAGGMVDSFLTDLGFEGVGNDAGAFVAGGMFLLLIVLILGSIAVILRSVSEL